MFIQTAAHTQLAISCFALLTYKSMVFTLSFSKGREDPPELMGIDNDQLLTIQNDLRERLKARNEVRERAVTRKL